jgi:hypothetical protein
MTMSIYRDFWRRADEYVRLAQKARTHHDRDMFLDMATAWLGLHDRHFGKAVLVSVLQADTRFTKQQRT